MKKLLAEQKSAPPSAAPSPARPVLKTLKTEKEPPRKKNRWNNLTDVDVKDQMAAAVVAEPKPAAPVAIKDVQAFDLTVEKPPPKKQVSPPPKPEPAPEPESEPEPMVVMEELEMPTVDVVFPYALNPDLMLLGRVDLAVNVPATASADDLVFEMRNALATKVPPPPPIPTYTLHLLLPPACLSACLSDCLHILEASCPPPPPLSAVAQSLADSNIQFSVVAAPSSVQHCLVSCLNFQLLSACFTTFYLYLSGYNSFWTA